MPHRLVNNCVKSDENQAFFAKAFSKIDHHGRIEGLLLSKFAVADEELQVRVFADRLDGLSIGEPLSLIYNASKATRADKADAPKSSQSDSK